MKTLCMGMIEGLDEKWEFLGIAIVGFLIVLTEFLVVFCEVCGRFLGFLVWFFM